MKSFRFILAGLLLAAVPFVALAKERVSSAKEAEGLLLDAAAKYHLAIEAAPGKYYVGGAIDMGEYFVIDLRRTNEKLPADWLGSDLAGWYGVRKKDAAIVEWNVAEDIPGKTIKNRNQKPPNQALQHNDPSCHVSCLRTPRASWGRG